MSSTSISPTPSTGQLSQSKTSSNYRDDLIRLSRSPHPYHRRKERSQASSSQLSNGYLPSPALTPSQSEPERDNWEVAGKAKPLQEHDRSPSESGTEADNEAFESKKALSVPNQKPRKGLRSEQPNNVDGKETPVLTPSALDEDARRFSQGYFESSRNGNRGLRTDKEIRIATEKLRRRRRAELLRRTSELLSLGSLGFVVLGGSSVLDAAWAWREGK